MYIYIHIYLRLADHAERVLWCESVRVAPLRVSRHEEVSLGARDRVARVDRVDVGEVDEGAHLLGRWADI